MSQELPVDIPSDSDSDDIRIQALRNNTVDLITPPPFPQSKKKQRADAISNPISSTVLIIDDDPTPCKQQSSSVCPTLSSESFVAQTPLSSLASIVECSMRKCSSSGLATEGRVVPETPMSELPNSEVTVVKYNTDVTECEPMLLNRDSPEISGLICLESDNESENAEAMEQGMVEQDSNGGYKKQKTETDKDMKPKRMSKEERVCQKEEKKQQKEKEKLLKAVLKAEAAELKKRQKEMKRWEKGKYALKSIVAEIDSKVVELGSIGGQLLTRFSEKGLSFRVTSNPVERSILWTMVAPDEISKIPSDQIQVSYVLIIYEAEEFCNHLVHESLWDHIQGVRHLYPDHTICCLTNRLMAYINKREQAQYKNPAGSTGWKRPAIEEVLAKLATDFFKVHSRQCVDEAELADHVVGLTCSLASCQFRKKLTRLSVNANGSIVSKDCVDKNLIKKNLWLKALVAIPKVQPRFAIAIWKKYPTMKSLLRIYMDQTKSVHEKEFLLKDLITEGLFGDDRRVGEVCSKRIYRILMAQCGSTLTDDVENGADFFSHPSTT